ncbi:zinc finger protein 510-like [Microcaecilia unicolor]|uniref:Zinc finger protein 510-like n=1 Tax=Microcaecilia unicolor TaxID=1415580 RepID=A0A6P7XLT6_9AMPH|nr:zinc finger protein 510-like [Microcaecilia unicolor]
MSTVASDQALVSFIDVAAYFLEVEWDILGERQKELYEKVIKAIHNFLISQGYSILNPDVIFKIKYEDEKYFTQHCEWEAKENKNEPSIRFPVVTSVFSLSIKQEKNLPFLAHPESETSKQIHPPGTGSPNVKPDILIRFKEEGFKIEPQGSKERGNPPSTGTSEELPETDDRFRNNNKRMRTCDGQQRKEWKHRNPTRQSLDPSAVCEGGIGIVTQTRVKAVTHTVERANRKDRSSSHCPKLEQTEEPKEGERHFKSADLWEDCTTDAHFGEHHIPRLRTEGHNCQGIKTNLFTDTISQEKLFKCSECDKCFKRKAHLQRHQMNHTGDKPFQCSECDKSFSQKSDLQNHKTVHTGDRPFKCSECDKCYRLKRSLQLHKMKHTGDKPFRCSECDKYFSQKSNLHKHEMIHTGHKPFKCSECNKCFRRKSNLQKHEMIHTGYKPFKCSECDKFFRQKTHLQKHKMIHTDRNVINVSYGNIATWKNIK